ncbi:MAG: thioredoxin domain-containing protein [Actinobacteria bacterium]|nr:thioredoxin domain-containing protein [Actinomycetota bacterium]
MLLPKPEPRETVPVFRFSPNPNKADKIEWYEWSSGAFEKAKNEKKPILLAIAAIWCHWCHVMDETSYSDEGVISLINERYIPIRVDADKRPDIQDRYLLGGWPTTAFLTISGEIITGGTYIPPGQFRRLLELVSDYYRSNHESLEREAEQKLRGLAEAHLEKAIIRYQIDRSLVAEVIKTLHRSFDSAHGGFSQTPKFPNQPAIELLLRRAFLEDETYLLEMATIILDHMANGGLFDKEWGGFFRYATERDWSKPHYEKILTENAGLIINYLHGYQVSANKKYREIAERTLNYVDGFLADKAGGGFSGSQDADEEFYKLDAEERLKHRIPYIDPIIYTGANASMVSAYIEAYKVLGGDKYIDFAGKTVDFLLANCYSQNLGMAHYYDWEPHFFGWLSDQAHMIGSLIDIYSVTGNRSYLSTAKKLVDICEKTLLDKDGLFFDRSSQSDEPELGALVIKNKPMQENALMARHIYRLAYVDGDDKYEKMAEKALANLELGPAEPIPPVAQYGLAVDEVLTQPVILTIIGIKDKPGTKALLKEAWRQYIPGKEIKLLDPIKDYEIVEKSGFPAERHPVMYPCIGRVCLPAVETANEFKTILQDLPGRPR